MLRSRRTFVLVSSAAALASEPLWLGRNSASAHAASATGRPSDDRADGRSRHWRCNTGAPAAGTPATGAAPATQPGYGVVATAPSTQPTTRAITINFVDTPIDTVLDHLSETAGFVVVKPGPIPGASPSPANSR